MLWTRLGLRGEPGKTVVQRTLMAGIMLAAFASRALMPQGSRQVLHSR
jgi:hypothetical protein